MTRGPAALALFLFLITPAFSAPPQAAPQAAPQADQQSIPLTGPSTNSTNVPPGTLSDEAILQLRDPFKPPTFGTMGPSEKINDLENFSIDTLKVIGVIVGEGLKSKAIIATPNSQTFIVSLNSKIGNRNGIVRRITERGILVRERSKNLIGTYDVFDIPLPLIEKAATANANTANNTPALAPRYKFPSDKETIPTILPLPKESNTVPR